MIEYNTILHTETVEGFTVTLTAIPEDHDWRDDFDEAVCDHAEIERNLDNCTWTFFIAKVEASKAGVRLGTDYLGSCMYGTTQEFLEGGYWEQMRDEAVSEAKTTLAILNA